MAQFQDHGHARSSNNLFSNIVLFLGGLFWKFLSRFINPTELELKEETVVCINRVSKATTGGRSMRFNSLVVGLKYGLNYSIFSIMSTKPGEMAGYSSLKHEGGSSASYRINSMY